MPDLAKKYTQQLKNSDNKPFVLSRMITEFCKIALPLKLVRKLYNLFGEYTIYNAIFSTANWVEREGINDQNDLYRYLYAVCRNLKVEELDEERLQQSLQKQIHASSTTKERIKEIYDRKRTAVGQQN